MITVEEFLNDIKYVTYSTEEKLITFARIHVTEALKQASEKGVSKSKKDNSGREIYRDLDKQSILNAYSLELIK